MQLLPLAGIFTPIILALIAGIFYFRGWSQIRQNPVLNDKWEEKYPHNRTTNRLSFILFYLSLICVLGALLPPLNWLGTQYFLFRMIRHLLLNTITPSLFFMADPLPALWQGMPAKWRQRLKRQAKQRAHWKTPFQLVFSRGTALFMHVAFSLMWFDFRLHQLAIENAGIRALEVILLLSGGFIYWWHISRAVPRLDEQLPTIAHALYTGIGAMPLKLAGFAFLVAQTPFYQYPNPDLGWISLTSIQSYRLGGAFIWMLSATAYSYSAAYFVHTWFDIEEQKPPLPHSIWDSPEAMMAPGFGKR